MSLEHAILGFLSYRCFSGYDLKKVFDSSIQHFWPAKQSQIYKTLSRMAELGWAEIEVVEQTDRPDRKVYHITDTGREEFRRWLVTPIEFAENRSAPMIQVFFSGQLSDAEILAIFEHVATEIRAGLAQYEHIPRNIEAYSSYTQSPREFFCWMLTLDIGISTARANLEFTENLIQRIRNGELPLR
jgi:PadR family transcriptional regulator, regulatory protein AphA